MRPFLDGKRYLHGNANQLWNITHLGNDRIFQYLEIFHLFCKHGDCIMLRKMILSAFSILLLSSCLFAQGSSGAIEGTVKDMDGRPIPGATVTVSSPSLIGGSSSATTDPSGYYRFPFLMSGKYEARASLPDSRL